MNVKIGYEESDKTYYIPLKKVLRQLGKDLTETEFINACKRVLERS